MDIQQQLHQKKIRQQLRFLQLELEETRVIYKRSVEQFNTDFRKFMQNPQELKESPQQVEDDNNLIIDTEVEDDTFKQLYRKVAGKTHPDKGGDDEKFKEANEANKKKDLGKLLDIADEVGAEILLDDKMISEFKKQITAIVGNIETMKTTMAWTWVHTPADNKEPLKEYILHQLGMI
jgi:hypothetical protein|tara:strand:- start:368 stop:901 length:534 start_codon:yes stop_codon:yes gene_type:complete